MSAKVVAGIKAREAARHPKPAKVAKPAKAPKVEKIEEPVEEDATSGEVVDE
jgi:hypothetical protein